MSFSRRTLLRASTTAPLAATAIAAAALPAHAQDSQAGAGRAPGSPAAATAPGCPLGQGNPATDRLPGGGQR